MVLSVPAVERSRYYAVQLIDGSTYNYGYIGTRATGTEAGDYMVVGPEWQGETPPGIRKVFRSGTQFSLGAIRTQLFTADALKAARIAASFAVGGSNCKAKSRYSEKLLRANSTFIDGKATTGAAGGAGRRR